MDHNFLSEIDLQENYYVILFLKPSGYQYFLWPVEHDSQIYFLGNLHLVTVISINMVYIGGTMKHIIAMSRAWKLFISINLFPNGCVDFLCSEMFLALPQAMRYWLEGPLSNNIGTAHVCGRNIRGGSRTVATSKMERFVKIAIGFQLLTTTTKCSTPDTAAAPDPSSEHNAQIIAVSRAEEKNYFSIFQDNSVFKSQKQPSRGILRNRCSENMQQIYRRSHPCQSAISIKLLYWNLTLAWVFSCKLAAYFQNTLS